MKAETISGEEWGRIFPNPQTVFGSEEFLELNGGKVQSIERICLYDEKGTARCGIAGGRDESGNFKAPFSAPFASLESTRDKLRMQTVESLATALKDMYGSVKITLPSEIYYRTANEASIRKAAFVSAGYQLKEELNYHLDLSRDFRETLFPQSKNHLNKSLKSGYRLDYKSAEEKGGCDFLSEAYETIARNRKEQGYPLAMTAEDLFKMVPLVAIDVFIVRNPDGAPAASAIVYAHSADLVQLIYWGDLQSFRKECPMYYLAWGISNYYKAKGTKIIDLGPSSQNGVIDRGLSSFKESIGGILTFKPLLTFRKAMQR